MNYLFHNHLLTMTMSPGLRPCPSSFSPASPSDLTSIPGLHHHLLLPLNLVLQPNPKHSTACGPPALPLIPSLVLDRLVSARGAEHTNDTTVTSEARSRRAYGFYLVLLQRSISRSSLYASRSPSHAGVLWWTGPAEFSQVNPSLIPDPCVKLPHGTPA